MHQSLLITGGDDQVITVSLVTIQMPNDTSSISEAGPCKVEMLHQVYGHSSAVRGLWFDGTHAFSVGLDRRVICWKLTDDDLLEETVGVCEIPEPRGLDAIPTKDGDYLIAISGRGTQVLGYASNALPMLQT